MIPTKNAQLFPPPPLPPSPLPSHTQVMLTLILIDFQYSHKAVFSFEKGSNYQNHSSSGSLQLVIKFQPLVKYLIPPYPLPLFGKPWGHCLDLFSITVVLVVVDYENVEGRPGRIRHNICTFF